MPRNASRLFGPKVSAQDGWRIIVRNETKLIEHVILVQSTMRLKKMIPTWSSFATTEYHSEMRKFLDTRMVQKYRAWWEVLLACGDMDRRPARNALRFSWATLHGKTCDPVRLGLSPELVALLREVVLMKREYLTLS